MTNIATHVKREEANVQNLMLNGIFTWSQDLKINALYVEKSFKNEVDKEKIARLFSEEFIP